ncbi:MAG: hypothetical protein MJ067_06280, partial [Oscillospiraceae bacterium]|nr:hypothetical protein [Oscillospiraceae bacterium]
FMLISVIAPAGVLSLYTNVEGVVIAGKKYMLLLGITFLFAGLSSTATYLLRSTGNVKIPLIGSAGAFFLNIFFNWVFIFGKLGAPRLELVGAAVGTIIARAFEFAFVFGYFIFVEKNFAFRIKHFLHIRGGLWGEYFRFAVPVLISDTLLGLSLSITSAITGHVGAEMSAASAIVMSIVRIITVFNSGMSGASAIVIGNTIGQGGIDEAKRQANTYVLISVVFGALMIPVLMLLENPYFGVYSVSEETIAMARKLLSVNLMFMPIETMAFVTSKGILRGGGDSRFLLMADSTPVWFLSIPLGALAVLYWNLSPFWVYFILRVEFPVKGIICLIRYATGKWIKQISSGKEEKPAKA